jgi:opacity protein-like surface antigen
MTKSFFAVSLLVFLLASNVSAWDMSSYVETAQAAEEKNDSTHVQKTEQKQSDTTDSSKVLTDNHVYRGLYFSAGIAFGYTSLNLSQNDWRKNKIVYKFSGLSIPYAEARLGHYFANIVSIYGTVGIGIGTGEYEASSQKQDKAKIDAISMRGIIGLGAELYPFQEKESALYGLYLGLCIGAAVERVQEDDDLGYAYRSAKTDLEIFDNTFARIEIGYDFWFGQRWRVGTAFSYSFGKYDSDDDDDIVTTSHNFSLAIRIAR